MATVLLVEDDPGVGRLLGTYLRAGNHDVLHATKVAEALAILDERASTVDVLVCDIGLPDGSGIHLASIYGERRPGAPVVFITGSPDAVPPSLRGVGTWRIMQKPFSIGRLVEEVQRVLDDGAGSGHAG